MSLVSLSDNLSQISLYENCQLKCQYICKFEKFNANQNNMQRKNNTRVHTETKFTRDFILWWKDF